MDEPDRLKALGWIEEHFDRFEKPYAMVETNDAADRTPIPGTETVTVGTPEKQAAHYPELLSMAPRRKFAFVISFVHQDYDGLWEKIKASAPALIIAWRDCGLLDQDGKPRPAYGVWKGVLTCP